MKRKFAAWLALALLCATGLPIKSFASARNDYPVAGGANSRASSTSGKTRKAGNNSKSDAVKKTTAKSKRSPKATIGNSPFVQVIIYDVNESAIPNFEAAVRSTRSELLSNSNFINERVLRNIDELTVQYATYTVFANRHAAESFVKRRLETVAAFCRRAPETHLAQLTTSYQIDGFSTDPTGLDFGGDVVGQIAHLGLFVPFQKYRVAYDTSLHEVKVYTTSRMPVGYIGEHVLVEADITSPEVQNPYSPRPFEASRMSINYGEYRTLENAEDSYLARDQPHDNPQLITLARVFYSSLQVPTRFYIFQVIDNFSNLSALAHHRAAAKGLGR